MRIGLNLKTLIDGYKRITAEIPQADIITVLIGYNRMASKNKTVEIK